MKKGCNKSKKYQYDPKLSIKNEKVFKKDGNKTKDPIHDSLGKEDDNHSRNAFRDSDANQSIMRLDRSKLLEIHEAVKESTPLPQQLRTEPSQKNIPLQMSARSNSCRQGLPRLKDSYEQQGIKDKQSQKLN